jgi:hypothetical protein
MALKSSIGAFGERINVAAVERKTLEAVCPGEVMRNPIVSSEAALRPRMRTFAAMAKGAPRGLGSRLANRSSQRAAFRKIGRGARKSDFRRRAFCGMQADVCDKILKYGNLERFGHEVSHGPAKTGGENAPTRF